MLECPECRSHELMIRLPGGVERLKIWFTQKREYRCVACQLVFRAADRRRYERATEKDSVPFTRRAD